MPSGGTISINVTTTLKAIAYLKGWGDSTISSGAYTLQCPTPVCTPVGAVYHSAQTVILTSSLSNATIFYTTDGTPPSEINGNASGTTKSMTSGGSVNVNANMTLEAIAYLKGWSDSATAIATYTLQCLPPSFSPPAGSYNNSQTVTLSSNNGTSIFYTLDGTTPGEKQGTPTGTTKMMSSGGTLTISSNTTVQAIASMSGWSDSTVSSAKYSLQCSNPTFSPTAGSYSSAQTVTLSSATTGSTIIYTTDGTTPGEKNGIPTGTAKAVPTGGTVPITVTTTLVAITYKVGYIDSSVSNGAYTLHCTAPTFSLAAGTYNTVRTVTITSVPSGATILYTTDGSTPGENNGTPTGTGKKLASGGTVSINATTTLKAIAYLIGWSDSTVTSVTYIISIPLTGVTVTPSLPSPQKSGTKITLSATVTGGTVVQYEFSLYNVTTGVWSALQSISNSATCSWTPPTSGIYQLYVTAWDTTSSTVAVTMLQYTVDVALTGVTLTTNPVSPQSAGTSILLTAIATGGTALQYHFMVYNMTSTTWSQLQAYSSTASCTWIPSTPGSYLLSVTAWDTISETEVSKLMAYTVLISK